MRPTECNRRRIALATLALGLLATCGVGCLPIPVAGSIRTDFHGDTNVNGRMTAVVEGPIEVKIPAAVDPGPMVATPVRAGSSAGGRVGMVDVDGLMLNQNLTGLYSVGENPVASFREKLEAAASDPSVRAIVVRINSPGGSVTASDIMAEELRRFRKVTGKPVVSCLMDLSTSGAYYLAVGGDEGGRALPTSDDRRALARSSTTTTSRTRWPSSTSVSDPIKAGLDGRHGQREPPRCD